MRKFLTLFAAFAVVTMAWANESGKLTSSVTPIDPSQTVTLTYDGTGTNFANWEPSCFIHSWLVAADGKTFSKSYSTDWAVCNGDADYALLDDKVKMTFVSKGKYTIDINLQSFFDVAEEDLSNIGKLGVIVRAQYPGENNQTEDMLLDVAVKGDDPEPPIPVENVTLFFVNVPAWEAVHAYVWPAEGEAYRAWPGEAATKEKEQINELDVYSYTFPGSYANIIFNNGDKGKQTDDLTWAAAKPYFYDGKWYAKEEIPTPEPPEELIYSIKNNWNGGEWAWRLMVESPTAEGLYEFSGYFGGTGVNIISSEEDAVELWFDLEHIVAKEAIEAGDSVLFIFDAKEVAVTAILIERPEPVVTPKFYITGNEALLGEDAWNPEKAIEVMEESYTFKALAAGKYELLVLLEKNWTSKRGYSDLTVKPEGVTTNDDNNIIFTLAEEGDVTVVLTSERFAIDGNFSVDTPEPPVVKTGYALLVNDIDTIALTHTEPFGDYDQWFVEKAPLKANDVVKVYNYETDVAWAIGILNEASSKHVKNSEDGLVFDKDGEYTMYLKLLFGLDEIYVAPLEDEVEPVVVNYFIKNNWNGGEWAWRLMVESPTAEGLYEFSGYFGGTGVNIISSEEDAVELWFDLEHIVAKEAIEAGDSVMFIFDAKEVAVTAILIERPEPVVTPDFYIIGSSELMGAWDLEKAIAVEGTTHTFKELPAGMYSMKVLLNNKDWSTAMGFNALTGEIPAGVTEGEQQNIVFTLDEPGDVTVTFKADDAGIVEFTVAGNFSTAVPVDFYITGNAALMGEEAAWTPEKAIHSESEVYMFKALAPGEYSLKVLTSNDGWSGAKGYTNLTFKPEGVTSDKDDNINFVLDKTGDVTITFKNGGEVFTIEGNFYVEPAPIVVMINIQLIIQIGQWPEGGIPQPKAVPARNKALAAADFKVAAWTWIEGDDASGKWSEFFTETEDFHFNGDVPETATHIIFVKFPKDALAPAWEGITDADKIYAGEIKPTHVFVVGENAADWEDNEYGILIGEATFVKAAYNAAQTEWKEFFIADQELLKGQTFVLYDNTVNAGWVVDKWSEGSYVFSIADEKYVVSEDGLYSIYIKMLGFGNDELYVSRKDLPSDIDNVEGALELRKVLENGTLYIYRDGKKYSVQGYVVR